jgi:pilus assembly protein CpaB
VARRLIVVLAAVVAALVGFVAVVLYARGADQRALAGQSTTEVYVAQQVVPAGTTAADAVSKGLITPTRVMTGGVPAGALQSVDDRTRPLVATTDIAAGEFVLASRFGPMPLAQKAIDVPAGQVAVAVQLADPAKVATFLTPGSHVVLYDSYEPASGQRATRVLLPDVLVIAVGANVLAPGGTEQPGAASGAVPLTVAVPPASALRLVHAVQTGTLYAGLLGVDSRIDTRAEVDNATLFPR